MLLTGTCCTDPLHSPANLHMPGAIQACGFDTPRRVRPHSTLPFPGLLGISEPDHVCDIISHVSCGGPIADTLTEGHECAQHTGLKSGVLARSYHYLHSRMSCMSLHARRQFSPEVAPAGRGPTPEQLCWHLHALLLFAAQMTRPHRTLQHTSAWTLAAAHCDGPWLMIAPACCPIMTSPAAECISQVQGMQGYDAGLLHQKMRWRQQLRGAMRMCRNGCLHISN